MLYPIQNWPIASSRKSFLRHNYKTQPIVDCFIHNGGGSSLSRDVFSIVFTHFNSSWNRSTSPRSSAVSCNVYKEGEFLKIYTWAMCISISEFVYLFKTVANAFQRFHWHNAQFWFRVACLMIKISVGIGSVPEGAGRDHIINYCHSHSVSSLWIDGLEMV